MKRLLAKIVFSDYTKLRTLYLWQLSYKPPTISDNLVITNIFTCGIQFQVFSEKLLS